MPCPYPTRSPDSAPAARRARVARRLAAGASVAEVAALEDIANSVVLSLLEEPGFQRLVEDYRAERELPEDERERLLIQSAWAGLLSLADMGDTKALLFIAYEGNRGRHPENRLRRLASFCHLAEAARESSSDCDVGEAGGAVVAGAAEPSAAAPAVSHADLTASIPEEPSLAASLLHPNDKRPALLGESRIGASETRRRTVKKP